MLRLPADMPSRRLRTRPSPSRRASRRALLAALARRRRCCSRPARARAAAPSPMTSSFGQPDAPAPLALDADYKIAPLDTLNIMVFQVADLSGEYEVDLTGQIALPLIGNVKAVDHDHGRARPGADRAASSARNICGIRTSRVGGHANPAAASSPSTARSAARACSRFAGQTTLIQAVAMARGTDDNANPRRVAVFRQVQGQRMAAAFDLVSIRRGQMRGSRHLYRRHHCRRRVQDQGDPARDHVDHPAVDRIFRPF